MILFRGGGWYCPIALLGYTPPPWTHPPGHMHPNRIHTPFPPGHIYLHPGHPPGHTHPPGYYGMTESDKRDVRIELECLLVTCKFTVASGKIAFYWIVSKIKIFTWSWDLLLIPFWKSPGHCTSVLTASPDPAVWNVSLLLYIINKI